VPCNIIIQYKPTKCTFPKLIIQFSVFDVFCMFRTPGFIFKKTSVYAAMAWYVLHSSV